MSSGGGSLGLRELQKILTRTRALGEARRGGAPSPLLAADRAVEDAPVAKAERFEMATDNAIEHTLRGGALSAARNASAETETVAGRRSPSESASACTEQTGRTTARCTSMRNARIAT